MIFTKQEPYVGKKYEDSTLFGVRVMVVGASHYCGKFDKRTGCNSECKCFGKLKVNYRDRNKKIREQYFGPCCQLFTKNVVERYLYGDSSNGDGGWKRTYTKFLKSLFKNLDASAGDCRKLVEHLAFTEYLQGAEGRDASDKNDKLFTDHRHYEVLKENIAKHCPGVVIVWGDRVWTQIEKRCNGTPLSLTRRETMIGNHAVQFVKVSHPSRRGYYKSNPLPQQQFVDTGIKLIDRTELLKNQI